MRRDGAAEIYSGSAPTSCTRMPGVSVIARPMSPRISANVKAVNPCIKHEAADCRN